jgi:ATP-dependent Clp endopeptidase proteolytic subunit ClpP
VKLAYRNQKNAEATARYWGKSLEKPDWYKIEAQTDDEMEIILYDVIGWPYSDAFDLVRLLSDYRGEKITVRINSPGGDVFDGLAVFNALREHSAKVTTRIEGLAASMASAIALAGDEAQAHKNSMMMIHDPWALVVGNQYDLREVADILQKIGGNLLEIYYDKSTIGKRELKQMMKDETWFTAQEAKERKLIDTVLDAGAAKAKFDLSMFARVPDELEYETREATEREKERALRDVGLTLKEAKAFLAGRREGAQRDVEDSAKVIINTIKTLKGE